jgi:long-chain acyl-CoA synthetase
MSFVDRFLANLETHRERAFVVEVHAEPGRAPRLTPTRGALLRAMVEDARHSLRSWGVSAGDRVVLVAPNSVRWVAMDLAIRAEGATVVPMYARQATTEIAAMIADADPRLVIVGDPGLEDALQRLLDGKGAPRVRLDALFEGRRTELTPAKRLAPDHVATIIYTSGSSGEPKGVMTTVANVEHMLPVLDAKLGELTGVRGGSDRVFHYLPFCFAGSRMVLWACLFRANGIHLSMRLEDLPRELEAATPEYFLNVPAVLDRVRAGVEKKILEGPLPVKLAYQRAMQAHERDRRGEAGRRDKLALFAAAQAIFPRIRQRIGPALVGLICGSAPLSDDTQAWFERIGLPIFQVYGLTETTAIVTIDRKGSVQVGRVGHAIPGCELRLGEGGELFVRGPNVFPGYFRKEAASDAAFDGEWFRTGDQCELDARGSLKVIGRVKNLLVPSSGHNVAPEPLEQRLLEKIPGAQHAVVIGHGRPWLAAIVSGPVVPSEAELALSDVNEGLPHYRRIRKVFVSPDRFSPENGLLTANQKLRRGEIERRFAKEIGALYGEGADPERREASRA